MSVLRVGLVYSRESMEDQEQECEPRPLPESILQVGAPREGRGQTGGRLKPAEVKVTIGGDMISELGGNIVTFESMRDFFVAYPDYEEQMHTTNSKGGEGCSRGGES